MTVSKQEILTIAVLFALLAAVILFAMFASLESTAVAHAGGSSTLGQCLISLSGCTGS